MATSKSKYNSMFQELASSKIHDYVKSYLSNLHHQLTTLRAHSFKPEHRDEFRALRSQCYDLIHLTHDFCDKIISYFEYGLAQFNPPEPVDIKILVEKLLSSFDPKHFLNECERLENKIFTFHERIATNEYYEMSHIMPFFCNGAGAALAIASLISLLFTFVVLEVEMALVALGFAMMNVTIPSSILLFEELTQIVGHHDFKQCKKMIIEAIDYISQMKMQLSHAIQNYDRLEIQLDDQDVYDLQSVYANLIENMQDVRAICSKPFHS